MDDNSVSGMLKFVPSNMGESDSLLFSAFLFTNSDYLLSSTFVCTNSESISISIEFLFY